VEVVFIMEEVSMDLVGVVEVGICGVVQCIIHLSMAMEEDPFAALFYRAAQLLRYRETLD